jgi:hypothetical protein
MCTEWPRFIHHVSSTRDTENWFALLERTTHEIEYISIWAPFIALRMSKRYSISRHVFSSIWVVTEATALLNLCTMFHHTANFWMEHPVLYIALKDKVQWCYSGGARGPRDWSVPPSTYVVQRLSIMPQCGGAPSYWKKTFVWRCGAICGTALKRRIFFSGSFEQYNPFPDISKTLWFM